MIKHRMSTAFVMFSLLFATGAQASNCANRDHVVDRLESKYSEQLAAGGLQSSAQSDSMVEIWASPETGTFTVLMTLANGLTCIVASGTDFFTENPVVKPTGIAG